MQVVPPLPAAESKGRQNGRNNEFLDEKILFLCSKISQKLMQ